jgi:hypothetical protein
MTAWKGVFSMKNAIIFGFCGLFFLSAGCAMFTAWKAIPPPGGCDQCHTVPIGDRWELAYKAPTLTDEKDRKAWQTEKYNMPSKEKPSSSLEVRKTTDEKCFECHRTPTPSHKGRTGRYHHGEY